MFLLQMIFKIVLDLCGIIGLFFMILSTILVIVSIVSGDISIQIKKKNEEKKIEEK
ncbi:hypothetical protein C806_01259 [Lachnospiraceae bacterium 3-1]|nr:hypothetical protein C806_01259 [Lachnospiraceae bacterium 3-1]